MQPNCMAFQWRTVEKEGSPSCGLKKVTTSVGDFNNDKNWQRVYEVYNKITDTHCCRCFNT